MGTHPRADDRGVASRGLLVALLALMTAPAYLPPAAQGQVPGTASITINPMKVIAHVPREVLGVNLEDLNFQVYGGLYSQMIHGESFQENIDSAALGLKGNSRLAVYVSEAPDGQLQLSGGRSANAVRMILGLPLAPEQARAPGAPGVPGTDKAQPGVPLSELPARMRQALSDADLPGRRVSRQWHAIEIGASGRFEFERKAPFVGVQSQIVTYLTGKGEVGIDNAGLNRWGLNLIAGKPYAGVLRVRSAEPATVWVSLLDRSGRRKLAEQAIELSPGEAYQRLEFTLTPQASDIAGRFAVTLKKPGTITLGYAYLEPGAWGRFHNLPVRGDLAQALVEQGVKVIRYDGSMVSDAIDGRLYHWKQMIGPRDERQPYAGAYNPYASNGWGIIDFLNFTEAAGIMPIPGVRVDESPSDMADFVEYVNGPVTSQWGAQRAADGHPEPYHLNHLEIGNEQQMDEAYVEHFKAIAAAVWAKDPGMILVIANSLINPFAPKGLESNKASWEVGPHGETSEQLQNAVDLVRLAQQSHGEVWWDQHYQAFPNDFEQSGISPTIGIIPVLKQTMDRLVPGNTLRIAALEENGATANLQRALVHARNLNAFFRLGELTPAVGIANALEASGQVLSWDQGVTHFTANEVFHQPSYYVDQAIALHWAADTIETSVSGPLDAQARKSADGKIIVLQVVNDSSQPVETALHIAGVELSPANPTIIVQLSGARDAVNTPAHPDNVKPQLSTWDNWTAVARYTFPERSVTLLEFRP